MTLAYIFVSISSSTNYVFNKQLFHQVHRIIVVIHFNSIWKSILGKYNTLNIQYYCLEECQAGFIGYKDFTSGISHFISNLNISVLFIAANMVEQKRPQLYS
jgi:hypothetical protein